MTSANSRLKKSIQRTVEKESTGLKKLALKIHRHPEAGYKEFKASGWLTEYLEKHGFTVQKGIFNIATAFTASYGHGRPQIGLFAEYDALPGIGHGCGHNLICTTACGAAVAAKTAVDELGGQIVVFGTPAEETVGAKVEMAEKCAFSDLDAAILVHPGVADLATMPTLALISMHVEFFGKSAHASANPEMGINALDAMIRSFNNINTLRKHIQKSARIHGIITDGGQAANIIPDYSAGEFMVRATTDAYLEELKAKLIACFQTAAAVTGARFKYELHQKYSAMKTNITLANLYIKNMGTLGRTVYYPSPLGPRASTDMGNVSQLVPSIHPMVAITSPEVSIHSAEFTAAAASEQGLEGMLGGCHDNC
jgi:amidohydrolase